MLFATVTTSPNLVAYSVTHVKIMCIATVSVKNPNPLNTNEARYYPIKTTKNGNVIFVRYDKTPKLKVIFRSRKLLLAKEWAKCFFWLILAKSTSVSLIRFVVSVCSRRG